MKNRRSLIWNPFVKIAGWQALVIGLFLVAATAVVAAYGNLALDGVVDAHQGIKLTVRDSLRMVLFSLLPLWFFMTLAGIVVNRDFRIIDILGTMALARFPMLLLALVALLSTPPGLEELMSNPSIIVQYPSFLIFVILSIPLVVWMVALYYNAFKVSVGGRGAKTIWAFIFALLLAEIASKALIGI